MITVFCCNNDVLLEKLYDIWKTLSQLHIGTIVPDIWSFPIFYSAFSHSFGTFISAVTFSHIALLGKLQEEFIEKKKQIIK